MAWFDGFIIEFSVFSTLVLLNIMLFTVLKRQKKLSMQTLLVNFGDSVLFEVRCF